MATFQTLEIWIGHNASRYHNLNALPHGLPKALPYIFSEICLVLGYLQLVTTRYHQFVFKRILMFFKKLTLARANPLKIVPNHAKLRENVR